MANAKRTGNAFGVAGNYKMYYEANSLLWLENYSVAALLTTPKLADTQINPNSCIVLFYAHT